VAQAQGAGGACARSGALLTDVEPLDQPAGLPRPLGRISTLRVKRGYHDRPMAGTVETPPTSRDDAASIRELEELWALPARPEPRRLAPAIGELVLPHLGKILAASWMAFFVATAFAPAADAEAPTPVWAALLIGGLFLSLFGALAFSAFSRRGAFGAAVVAGCLGVALAVGCKATEHHGGSWWAYELGATLALTGLAALGLRRSARQS
jgi:hypothetical protein